MDHKYKSLLQNIPTRHLITAVDEAGGLKKQLTKMRDLDVVNFFILGRLATIKTVLDAATAIKFFGKKFAWFVITQVCLTLHALPIYFFSVVEIAHIQYYMGK